MAILEAIVGLESQMAYKIRFTNAPQNGRIVGDALINLPISREEANVLATQMLQLIRRHTDEELYYDIDELK